MKSIKTASCINISGIEQLFLLPKSAVVSMDLPRFEEGSYMIQSLTHLAAQKFVRVFSVPEYTEFSMEENNTADGPVYTMQMQALITAESETLHSRIHGNTGDEFILLFLDNHGNYRIMGSSEYGARMQPKTPGHSLGGGFSAYYLNFTWNSGHADLYYNGDVTLNTDSSEATLDT